MWQNLEPKQIKAAQLLAEGRTTCRIIEEIGICADTLYRWKKLPEFKALVDTLITDDLAETRWKMTHLVDSSYHAIWKLVNYGSVSDDVKLKAALSVLKLAGIERIPVPDRTEPPKEANADPAMPPI